METRTSEYECGERLICREYIVIDNHIFNASFQYDIVEIVDGALLLRNVKDGKLHPLPLDKAGVVFHICFLLYLPLCARSQCG